MNVTNLNKGGERRNRLQLCTQLDQLRQEEPRRLLAETHGTRSLPTPLTAIPHRRVRQRSHAQKVLRMSRHARRGQTLLSTA